MGAEPTIHMDVLVVGAGQAGLATGAALQRTGLTFRLFDRAVRVGDSWRRRYDLLVLFSTRAYSSLPELRMAGDPEGYPSKHEIADYLESYANVLALPITLGDGIAQLTRGADGFGAVTDGGTHVTARAVVVAAGAFQRSTVPTFARGLSPDICQLAAETYRSPSQLPDGRVLVVGGGATGRQIAYELARVREVSLSTGQPINITPQRVFSRDVMAWFDALGFLRADKATAKGRFARAHESFPGWHLRSAALRRGGIRLHSRVVDGQADTLRFGDGSTDRFNAVIWAMGYRDDATWLQIPGAANSVGQFIQDRGVSPVPGLVHVGRSWQTSRASALVCGVAFDAAAIVKRITEFMRHFRPGERSSFDDPRRVESRQVQHSSTSAS
jgi:putative flavoprotein involved in K+ transport